MYKRMLLTVYTQHKQVCHFEIMCVASGPSVNFQWIAYKNANQRGPQALVRILFNKWVLTTIDYFKVFVVNIQRFLQHSKVLIVSYLDKDNFLRKPFFIFRFLILSHIIRISLMSCVLCPHRFCIVPSVYSPLWVVIKQI